MFRILQHFKVTADSHAVIFTSGATESLKLVAETFDFGSCSKTGTFKIGLPENDSECLFFFFQLCILCSSIFVYIQIKLFFKEKHLIFQFFTNQTFIGLLTY